MDKDEVIKESLAIADKAAIVMLGTNGDSGFPNIKAMFKMEKEGLKTIWFSTNTSSKRVAQLRRDSKACVYFADRKQLKGLMLVGNIDILQDNESKQRLWREGFELYYPQGVTDPDYSVLRFTTLWGNYYHMLTNVTFEL